MKRTAVIGSLVGLLLPVLMVSSAICADPPKFDATGTWDVTLTGYWESCPEPSPPPSTPFPITINQTGSSFTLTEEGEISHGTVDGDRYRLWESYADGGMESLTRILYLATPSSATGYYEVTWSDGFSICSWGGDVTMRKQTQYSCTPSDTQACLNKGRFAVSVTWKSQDGKSGVGHVVPGGSDDSGMFWFFSESNWELLIKVLDGCHLNSRYWVFFAATTDQEFTVTVTDTMTSQQVQYTNPLKHAADAVTDTDAFATCP